MYFALSKKTTCNSLKLTLHKCIINGCLLGFLEAKLKADVCIYQDPLVLQWLVTSLGYERRLTDFGHTLHGSLLALSTVLPPKERVDLNEAKDKWVNFWTGSLNLHAMFQLYGNKICMVAPERFYQMPFLTSKLQRGLFDMHSRTMAKLCDPDWKLVLLCNVNKFPLDTDTRSELIELGLCMS